MLPCRFAAIDVHWKYIACSAGARYHVWVEHLTAEYKNEEVGLYPNKPTSAGKTNRSENANSAAIAVGRTRPAVGRTRPDRLSVSPDYVFQ